MSSGKHQQASKLFSPLESVYNSVKSEALFCFGKSNTSI